MLGVLLIPIALLLIVKFAISGPRFSARRAAMSIRSLKGDNAAKLFAVFGATELVMSTGGDLTKIGWAVKPVATVLGLLLVLSVVAVVLRKGADTVLLALGAILGTISAFIEFGKVGGVLFLILVTLAFTLLMLVSGWLPGRRLSGSAASTRENRAVRYAHSLPWLGEQSLH